MTKGEMMVALGIGGLVLTFVITIISSIILHRKEKMALAEQERREARAAQIARQEGVMETAPLDRGKAKTNFAETAALKNNLKETETLN